MYNNSALIKTGILMRFNSFSAVEFDDLGTL